LPEKGSAGIPVADLSTSKFDAMTEDKEPGTFDLRERTERPPLDNEEAFVEWMLKHTREEEYFLRWRWECAQDLLRWSSIKNDRVLEAFLRTPREIFIREANRARAYEHNYLPIGFGATITDPWVVTVMTQTLDPQPHHKVLEVGTGSGYQSAILAQLSNRVYTIEIIEELAKETHQLYSDLEQLFPEYTNILRKTGDGYYGWPGEGPFDRIIVTCSIDHIPPDLLRMLASGGIMVIPIGPPAGQTLMKISSETTSEGKLTYRRSRIMDVKFIPFKTKGGKPYSIRGS
jgi:protein-L-isoaspartate(D-aspartate) O-methyltransferase